MKIQNEFCATTTAMKMIHDHIIYIYTGRTFQYIVMDIIMTIIPDFILKKKQKTITNTDKFLIHIRYP